MVGLHASKAGMGKVRMRGISMIEMMLVLLIMALTLAAGIPLARGWVADAQLSRAESLLHQGVAKARAQALRNPLAVSGSAVAASVQIVSGTRLEVRQGSTGNLLWSAQVKDGVQLLLAASAGASVAGCGNQLAFDNNGMPVTACRHYLLALADGYQHAGLLP